MAYCLCLLMLFSQNFLIFIIMTQEIKSNYNPTRNKKVFADKAIRTTGPILWNFIGKNIKKSISTKYFRKLYKSSLINSYT